jgi:hypothetical protein
VSVAFRIPDVLARYQPVEPEQLVLGTYCFLPHHRTGAAAGLHNRVQHQRPGQGDAVTDRPSDLWPDNRYCCNDSAAARPG